MALKYSLPADAHAALDATVQPLYKANAEGTAFVLDVEIAQGENGIEDVAGIKSALHKERDFHKKAARELATLRESLGSLTPEQIAEAAQRLQTGEDDAVVQATVKLRADNDTLRTELQTAARANALRDAVTAARGNHALLLPYAEKYFKYDGAKVECGGQSYDTVAAAVAALRAVPDLGGAFAGSGNSGGGIGGGEPLNGGGTGGNTLTLPKTRSRMSISQKAAYISANGTDAFMRLPA